MRTAFADPTLRMIMAALLFMGALNSSAFPYQSLIAVERIGMAKPVFAMVLVLASGVAVTASVLFGIMADQRAGRRRIALISASASVLGLGLMLFAPGPVSFALCHGILLPIATSLYGQLFALARLALSDAGPARDGILSTIRAALSISFLSMLIFWTFAFGAGVDVMATYYSALGASAILALIVAFGWPRDGQTRWEDIPSGLNLRAAFAEIARPRILGRLVLLGAIASAGNLYMVLVSLVFDASPTRGTADVALYVGMVAGWEVPFFLILPRIVARVQRSTLIALGTASYTLHLVLMPFLAEGPMLWVLPLCAGLGGAAIIVLPIAYYQDLIAGRPGTAGAMLAVQKLISDTLAAGAFALGTHLGGYELAAILGTSVALAGAAGLWLADRRRGAWRGPAAGVAAE